MKDVKLQVLYEDQKTLLREMNEDLHRAASYIYGLGDSVLLFFWESGILLCVRPGATRPINNERLRMCSLN